MPAETPSTIHDTQLVQEKPLEGSLHSDCSVSLVIDVLRGPDVETGARVIDANIKSAKHGINWTKTRRHLEAALKAAKQGNVVQVTILMQQTSLPNTRDKRWINVG